jgi:mannose-6-phosphate isomerase-like protein (cupin superfamily)
VKLVYVDGDKRLSLQYHHHRTEFWKVVHGPVTVQVGQSRETLDTRTLEVGETVVIPPRTLHRLIGAGTEGVVLEISTGDFDEADIVRVEDDYKR